MKKIRSFFSIVVIILIILSIFIYIFLNNFEKEKIISDIEKKFEIKIKCAEELISEVGGNVVLTVVAIELNALKGREKIKSDVFSVLRYD